MKKKKKIIFPRTKEISGKNGIIFFFYLFTNLLIPSLSIDS